MKWAHPHTEGVKRRNSRHEDEIAVDIDVSTCFFQHTPQGKTDDANAVRSLRCLIPDDAPIWEERRPGTRVYKIGEEPKE